MKRFGLLLALVAVALGAFNTWQISRLRSEMGSARRNITAPAPKAEKPKEPGVQELLANAQAHSARARKLMAKGDSKSAREEMQKSLDALREAEGLVSAQTSGLRNAFESARGRIEDFLAAFGSEKAGKARGSR